LLSGQSVTDPRVTRRKRHKLVAILVLALCGFVAGCKGWVDVELFGLSKRNGLAKVLELPNGVPAHDTFGRVFALLDPQQLTRMLRKFVHTVTGSLPEEGVTGALPGEGVAIDGKTLRRSGAATTGQEALHLVSAWATPHGVVLGPVATAAHSHEITALPVWVRLLAVRGATVTMDALGCQKEIARQVREQGADSVLAVKGNHKSLEEVVRSKLGRGRPTAPRSTLQTRAKNHGRTEQRTSTARAAPSAISRHWPDAQRSVRVCREVTQEHGTKANEVRHFLSSLPPEVERWASLIRGHWRIENQWQWSLDVTFNEDRSRIRPGHAAENAAL
jgi:predicted transposase YbfD/YdcC